MLPGPTDDHVQAVEPVQLGPVRFGAGDRTRAVRFAVVGNLLPVLAAVVTQFSTHRTVFFVGAALGCAAPVLAAAAGRGHRLPFWLGLFGGIPAFTLMQAYTGGAASDYSVLLVMAMIWFGLRATDG